MRKKKDRPKRLTRKEFLTGCEYALNPWASGNEAQDKLGPIEDIEDELGIDAAKFLRWVRNNPDRPISGTVSGLISAFRGKAL